MIYLPTFEGVVLMRYTNSEKISVSYLLREKDKVRKILDENDFPFMEEYRQRIERIASLEERYEQLKEYMHLCDELSAWIGSEPFKKEVAKHYIQIGDVRNYWFFMNILEKEPIAEIGCLTEWQDFVRQFYQKVSPREKIAIWYWKNDFTTRYWRWEGYIERREFMNGNPMDDALIKFLSKVMQIPDEELLDNVFTFLDFEVYQRRYIAPNNYTTDGPKREKVPFHVWGSDYVEEFRPEALSRKYGKWLVGFDFSKQDLRAVNGFHFRQCNLKDTGAKVDLSYKPDTIPEELSGYYQLNLVQSFGYFNLRDSNFQGCEIIGFDPAYFYFSEYTFDKDYLKREWPTYVIDERVPTAIRNFIYDMSPVEFSWYNVKANILRSIPYFSQDILKRIIRIYHSDGFHHASDERCLIRIMERLNKLYDTDSYWYELMRKE